MNKSDKLIVGILVLLLIGWFWKSNRDAAAYQEAPFIVFWIVIACSSYLIKMLTPILMRGPTSPTSQSPDSSP